MERDVPTESPVQKRVLAAIVFTDVVGFSKLAGQNESRAFVAVQRDLTMMQNLCRSHRGEVLNTMGDGMMMCFGSAVDAMACALEIQRTLYSQSKSLPPGDRLQHRIGVHLGDIIRDGDNVFGDGVNIAARLQAAAKPDSILYSQTVHDVVKHKLKFDSESVSPQQLKNVGVVRWWQVPPIRDFGRVAMALSETPLETDTQTGSSGLRALMMIVVSLVLVGGLAGMIIFMKKPAISESNGKNAAALAKKLADLKKKNGVVSKKEVKKPEGPKSQPSPIQPENPDVEADTVIRALVERYDFEGAIAKITERKLDKTAEGMAAVARFQTCANLLAWIQSEVSSATAEKPIMATLMAEDGKFYPAKVYQGKLGVTVDFGSKPMDQTLRDFKPASIASLGQSIEMAPVTAKNNSAPGWIATFMKEFNVTL